MHRFTKGFVDDFRIEQLSLSVTMQGLIQADQEACNSL
jgi:hypothetical protein